MCDPIWLGELHLGPEFQGYLPVQDDEDEVESLSGGTKPDRWQVRRLPTTTLAAIDDLKRKQLITVTTERKDER